LYANGLKKRRTEYATDNEHYRLEEYRALTGKLSPDELESDDFIREAVDVTNYNIPALKSLSLIHKVREVRALTGFTRFKPSWLFRPWRGGP
jgi:hypothetical protein